MAEHLDGELTAGLSATDSSALLGGCSMRRVLTTAAALFLFVSGDALADWHEASSDHFVIYADESEKEIRKYSDRLERYYSAMSVVLPSKEIKPSPSNRVTIYVVRNERIVRKLYGSGSDSRYVQGFYLPRAGGSLAIIPPIDVAGSNASESELVLMHEYAHHFMAENAPYLVPRWYGEGFAEYFATAKFESNGAVGLGLPAQHRAYELFEARDVSIEQLLDSKLYAAHKSKNYDNFYGRSWLLFHYLFTDDRAPQAARRLSEPTEPRGGGTCGRDCRSGRPESARQGAGSLSPSAANAIHQGSS